jgi:hypothetical protein
MEIVQFLEKEKGEKAMLPAECADALLSLANSANFLKGLPQSLWTSLNCEKRPPREFVKNHIQVYDKIIGKAKTRFDVLLPQLFSFLKVKATEEAHLSLPSLGAFTGLFVMPLPIRKDISAGEDFLKKLTRACDPASVEDAPGLTAEALKAEAAKDRDWRIVVRSSKREDFKAWLPKLKELEDHCTHPCSRQF